MLETEHKWTLRGRRVSLETLIETQLTSMTLVFRFCYMSSVRSTSDGRGPVTRKRVPDREEQGKPSKDARRGRCHPLEAGFWPLWMTPLPRTNITEYRIHKEDLKHWSCFFEDDDDEVNGMSQGL